MYKNYYKLQEKPFELTPDPKFLFLTKEYKEILSSLIYGVVERRGILALVGEVGSGKTLLLNSLLVRLQKNVKSSLITNCDLTFKQLLTTFLHDIGASEINDYLSKEKAIIRLNEFAIKQLDLNSNIVLIIDEAQNLNKNTMENIRMLSNMETFQKKLIQIVLSGQPEFDTKLKSPDWSNLVQRISLKRYTHIFDEKDTYAYIKHRLTIAGCNGQEIFSKEAIQLIYKVTNGIPRKINIVCDNALLIGYGLSRKKICKEIICEVIEDLKFRNLNNLKSKEINVNEKQVKLGENEKKQRILIYKVLVIITITIFTIFLIYRNLL